MTDPVARDRLAALLHDSFLGTRCGLDYPEALTLADRLLAAGVLPPDTLAKVRAEIERELALVVTHEPRDFEAGCAAAYNFVLSLLPPAPPMTERERFLWQRSVEISAFEALSEEDDARLWAEAQKAADVLYGPLADPPDGKP